VLAPKDQSAVHAALFEQMAQALQFELAAPAAGADRARDILQASFLLADVSGNDPEVLYDVGVAHTFGKRVFLVTDSVEGIPYDLAGCRAWVVDPAAGNRDIVRALAQFLSVPYAIGPVRVFLGRFAFFGENLIARRFLAFLFDAAWMLLLLGFGLHLIIPADQVTIQDRIDWLYRALDAPRDQTDERVQMVMGSAFYFVFAYFALSTWLLRASFGQLLAGLRVLQTDYRRATFAQCVGRAVLSVLVVLTYGASFLWAMRGPGYRAAHDVLSGTIVARSLPALGRARS
jgi:uncharacterized RDD family membrane protein YckC